MPLKRTFFTVLLDDPENPDAPAEEYHVEIRATDQLRAELEGKRIPGLTLQDGMHTTYLWAWAALVRLGHFAGRFDDFKARCVATVKDDEEDENQDVDPTRSAASGTSA